MTKQLIVNADDLGISIPVNLAIRRAYCDGIVTSASLLANMPAFGHAVEEVIRPNPGLGVGVHLCATSGPPVLGPERVPLLVGVGERTCPLSIPEPHSSGCISLAQAFTPGTLGHRESTPHCPLKGAKSPVLLPPESPGVNAWARERIAESTNYATSVSFRRGFVGLWRLLHSRRREEALSQIQAEWAAQIARAEEYGLTIDHLDSHQHVHMIPALFDLVVGLAQTRKIAIRVAGEAFRFRQRGPTGSLGCLANGGLLKNAVLTHFARVNHRKWPNVLTTDHYFGVLDTGRMTSARLQNILRSLPDGVSEVTMHPSLPPQASGEESGVRAHDDLLACSRQDQRFLRRHRAAQELAALLDPAVRETLATQDLRLARFQDLAACRSAGSHCVAVSRRPSISSTTTESTASGA